MIATDLTFFKWLNSGPGKTPKDRAVRGIGICSHGARTQSARTSFEKKTFERFICFQKHLKSIPDASLSEVDQEGAGLTSGALY